MKKFKRVVVLGCSCAFGAELEDPLSHAEKDSGIQYLKNKEYRLNHVYGKLVADYLGAELDMFACPAASIGHMRWQAQNWLEQTPDISDWLELLAPAEKVGSLQIMQPVFNRPMLVLTNTYIIFQSITITLMKDLTRNG